MSNGTELRKPEEPTGSLDCVNRAIDAVQTLEIPWILFQGDKILIKLIKVLLGFLQELAYELFVFQRTFPSAD